MSTWHIVDVRWYAGVHLGTNFMPKKIIEEMQVIN